MKQTVAADIRSVLYASTRADAELQLLRVIDKYEKTAPKLAAWVEDNLPEGLTVFDFPQTHWRRLGTTNCLERLNREIARRTRVVSIFPSDDSCLRLATAIVMEISEEWLTAKTYLKL